MNEQITTMRRPRVVAHRGAHAIAPENTLAAVAAAVSIGVDAVEVDVQSTRDGTPVVLHDPTLARTTDVARRHPGRAHDPVWTFTDEEVRRLDAGSARGAAFGGEPVPTLEQVVDVKEVTAPQVISHFNLFRSATINGSAARAQATSE